MYCACITPASREQRQKKFSRSLPVGTFDKNCYYEFQISCQKPTCEGYNLRSEISEGYNLRSELNEDNTFATGFWTADLELVVFLSSYNFLF